MQYDLIRISLISLYAAALLGPPLPGPYLLTQRPCLDLRCQALTYLLTRCCDARAGDLADAAADVLGFPVVVVLFLQSKFLF
jgi:hypothetical protein